MIKQALFLTWIVLDLSSELRLEGYYYQEWKGLDLIATFVHNRLGQTGGSRTCTRSFAGLFFISANRIVTQSEY